MSGPMPAGSPDVTAYSSDIMMRLANQSNGSFST